MDRALARPRAGLHHLGPVSGQPATVAAKPEASPNEGDTWGRVGVVGGPALLRVLWKQDAGRIPIDSARSLLLFAAADRADRPNLRRAASAETRRVDHSPGA